MKQFLRLFAAVSIILLAALISAVSCGKTAGGGNNNSGNNNSGNGNNGGDGTVVVAPIKVTISDAALAKRSGASDIVLKATQFPLAVAGNSTSGMASFNNRAIVTTWKKAFELSFEGSTGGMTIVADGNVDTNAIALPAPAAFVQADTTGIRLVSTATASRTTTPLGTSIVGIFADKTAPADAAQTAANVAPFAFSSATTTTGPPALTMQPVFWCVSTLTEITDLAAADLGTKKLTGGEKSSCYFGTSANDTDALNDGSWLAATGNIKRAVTISAFSIKTDAKTVLNIGLPGADDAAKLAALRTGGISAAELKAIATAAGNDKGTAFSKFTIKVVNDADWAAAPAATP